MYTLKDLPTQPKEEFYRQLGAQTRALLDGERDAIANMANFASLLFHMLPEINWAGFYFLKDGELVLGPFQGKPACIRIEMGKGVCGSAAQQRKTLLVKDVDDFPGHIACDPDSRSEIVLPIIKDRTLHGVLDIDSPRPDRFDKKDAKGLEMLLTSLTAGTDFS